MKAHLTATIDQQIVDELERLGKEERRSRSQLIELALVEFLARRGSQDDVIVTSSGRFKGSFSREDTYAR